MKIVCIGMNYGDHLEEISKMVGISSERPSVPVFFIKPDTAMLRDNGDFYVPDFSNDVQYECEFVVKISRVAKAVSAKFAHRYYDQVGLGIDFTARDLQSECKRKGLPWEIAKGFDNSAVVGIFVDKGDVGALSDVSFELVVNNQVRQRGVVGEMFFGIDEIIEYVSRFVTLRVGDLIFTGTPKGVGRVEPGDRLIGRVNGEEMFNFEVK